MSSVISNSASELVKAMKIQDENKKEELLKSINNHALNAAGLGLIPIPLADIAALTVNVWHMYVKINKILDISFRIMSRRVSHLPHSLIFQAICLVPD